MNVPLEEQETVIQFNRTDDYATIYTSDSTMITKLDKCCDEAPEFYKLQKEDHLRDGSVSGKTYILSDRKMLSFRKTKRVVSEEQKEIARQNMLRLKNLADCASSGTNTEI